MKRIVSFATAVFLVLTLILPAAVLAAPQITLVQPASLQFIAGAPNTLSINAASPGSNITSAEFQALFSDAPGTLIGLEIFAQTPISVPAPRAGAGARSDTTPVPAGLPPSSIASIIVLGTVTSVNPTTGEWQIGTPPIFVYESTNITTFQGIPTVGTAVRVEASRTLASGPIVARTIARLAGGTLPAPPPTMDMSFLLNGTIESVQPAVQSAGMRLGGETWTIGGVPVRVNDANFPAIINPGIGLGAGLNPVVTTRFRTPLAAGISLNTALEIYPQVSDVIPATRHPTPVPDTEPSPANLPASILRLFVIGGVVTSVNATAGEWQIGTPPVFVYESASTNVSARRPVPGDEVIVVAKRTIAPGPIVADNITFQATQSLPAAPATKEKTFLFNGTVGATGAATWTIGGASFVVNDPQSPAVIRPGLVVGSAVTVEFSFVGPPPPDVALWAPLTLDPTTNLRSAVVTPPVITTDRTGFLFLRATDAQQQVTTMLFSVSLLVTAPAPPPPPSGGGGGGGGGGAPPPPPPPPTYPVTLTGLSGAELRVNDAGVLQQSAQLTDNAGQVTLSLERGTTLLDSAGKPPTSLSMKPATSPPAPPPQRAIIAAYDFGPDGATFDPPITLTLSYDPNTLPPQVGSSDLVVAFWDGNAWQQLESTVNPGTNTISVQVTHFTLFAVMAKLPPPSPPAPAQFTVSELSIAPATVKANETVTISGSVSNTGGSPGKVQIVLKINGVQEATQDVSLNAGVNQKVSFPVQKSAAGTYSVGLEGLGGQFTVTAEPVAPLPAPLQPVPPPAPAPAPTPAASPSGPNWILISGLIAAAVVVIGLAVFLVRRRTAGY